MILIFIKFFMSVYGSTCDEELKRIVEVDIVQRVNSYIQSGTGLDWIESFEPCKENKDSTYATVLWKLNSAVKVTYGFCLPKTCSRERSEVVLNELIRNPILAQVTSDEISSVLFDFKGPDDLHPAGKFFLYSFYSLLILTGICSILGLFVSKENVIKNFSLFDNLWKFLTEPNSFGNLQFFDGIRSICAVSLLIFHGFFMIIYIPMTNRAYFNSLFSTFQFTLIVSISLIVDIFFFIAGFLMSYLTVQSIREQKEKFRWGGMIVRRLVRYLPAYFFVIGMERCGAGGKPASLRSVIPYVTTLNVSKDWWGSLLFIHHLLSETDVPYLSWTWTVACDFQFYLICSIILYIYSKNKTFGYFASFSLLGLSIFYTFVVSQAYHFSPSTIQSVLNLRQLNTIYFRPLPRIGCFLIGLILGFIFLESTRKKQGKISQAYEFQNSFGDLFESTCLKYSNSSKIRTLLYICSFITMSAIVAGPYYLDYYGEDSISQVYKSIWLALNRPLFVTSLGVYVFSMALGHLKVFSWLLSLKVFQYFSKISYTFYMIHCMVFGALFMNGDDYIEGSFYTWICMSGKVLAYSTLIAFVLEVLVQMPFIRAEKWINRK